MYGANRLALAILLIFVAGILFFVALHPGGIQISDPNAKDGVRTANNPAEVLGYLMSKVG
jgi:hypothetical protein